MLIFMHNSEKKIVCVIFRPTKLFSEGNYLFSHALFVTV
jgi:hypothetical protein